jgi:hypothetical protein
MELVGETWCLHVSERMVLVCINKQDFAKSASRLLMSMFMGFTFIKGGIFFVMM